MLGFSVFAALLLEFKASWQLTNTEAGWISSIFFVGYTLGVPLLVTLTDRFDPKKIYLLSAIITAAASFGFAMFAQGFWTALLFRGLAGLGLAGTYMPGLKALSDHLDERHHSRATAFYISGFGVGGALSYPFAGFLARWADWPAAFIASGFAAVLAALIVLLFLPRSEAHHLRTDSSLLDLGPVLRNRSSLAYTFCYTMHNWELFALRGWVVAFLVFAEGLHGNSHSFLEPTIVAAVVTILGQPASILGNELSIRWGRARAVAMIMAGSAVVCFITGFTSAISYALAVLFVCIHGFTVMGESASVTAGALGNAPPGYRGATMAVHSTVGFSGAVVGPLVFGWILDLASGQGVLGWGLAFAHMGLVLLLGPLILALLRPRALAGDRAPSGKPVRTAGAVDG